MAGAPLQCSIFLVREKGLLHEANSAAAQYLFQQDKFYDVSYDTGDKSIQCGRKVGDASIHFLYGSPLFVVFHKVLMIVQCFSVLLIKT